MLIPVAPPPITIWIHGTTPKQEILHFLSDINIDHVYKFFYCKPGLTKAREFDSQYQNYAIAQHLAKSDPIRFPLETFYVFGWSGKLDAHERKKAAQELYQALKNIIANYQKKYACYPSIRIITHSHGGNVALNLAALQENMGDLIIDTLILLACPVQYETEHCIPNPIFKKIYSIHSHRDFIQILDPQGWPYLREKIKKLFKTKSIETIQDILKQLESKTFFSERHFSPHKKLTQVHIKINNRSPFHIEFLLSKFIKKLPFIIEQIEHAYGNNNQSAEELLIHIETT